MNRPFHLSIGVHCLETTAAFFENLLQAKIVHRDPKGSYVNIDFFGNQITLKPTPDIRPDLDEFHFGVNLDLVEFSELLEHIERTDNTVLISKKHTVDKDTLIERQKFYLRCPTGYIIEIKGY